MKDHYTVTEIAHMYGVTKGTITAYKARGQMPPPDLQVGRTPVWKKATLEAWRPLSKRKGNA